MRLYDVLIEDVSILEDYRTQLDIVFREQGLVQLLNDLGAKQNQLPALNSCNTSGFLYCDLGRRAHQCLQTSGRDGEAAFFTDHHLLTFQLDQRLANLCPRSSYQVR